MEVVCPYSVSLSTILMSSHVTPPPSLHKLMATAGDHQKRTKMSLGQKSSNFCKFFTTEKKNDMKSVSSNHGQEKMNNKQDARNEPRYDERNIEKSLE